MLHNYAAASLITALLFAPPPEALRNLPYRWLTSGELETLLRGSRIEEADLEGRASWERTPEEFHSNGWYVRHADNYEANGRYAFRDDAVCDHAYGEREVCRKILIDKEGRYWIVGRWNPGILIRISIKPLR